MTQRSFEVSRVGNGIRDGTRRIIHAAGVCVDVRERKSNIIHAAGVRGDFTSSAPRARNALRSQEKLPVGAAIRPRGWTGPLPQHLPCGKTTLLPGGKTPPNWSWWWVTFGEQSRVISRECRSFAGSPSELSATRREAEIGVPVSLP